MRLILREQTKDLTKTKGKHETVHALRSKETGAGGDGQTRVKLMRGGRWSRRKERNKSKKTHDETNLQRLITNTKHDRDGAQWKHQTNQYNSNGGHLSSVVRSYVTSAAAGLKT